MRHLKDRAGLDQVRRDMEFMCNTVGRRLAGSPEEERVADYMVGRLRELGATSVGKLPFSVQRWLPAPAVLTDLDSGRRIEVGQVTHSLSTPPEGVEGDLAIIEPFEYEHGMRLDGLEGKIGLFYGGYGESAELFRQMQESPLKALLYVDTRYATEWPIAMGMGEKFMRMVKKPMASVSMMDAWALARSGARRVRLTCSGRIEPAASWNAVGEFSGSDPAGRVIVISGHLDSVSVGAGADDNASGIAATLECARRLRGKGLRHTLRFIGFGDEEQLSVGAMRYVESQAADLDRVAFVFNHDAIGAYLGSSEIQCTGTQEMDYYVKAVAETRLRFGKVVAGVCPYQDMFPFAMRGIPGVWLTRPTHGSQYWYHHSVHSDLGAVSIEQIAWTAEVTSEIVGDLARHESWPFERRLAPEMREKCERYMRELF